MRSTRPPSQLRRALCAAGLGAAGVVVFALGVHLGTQGLPALSGGGRFDDVTSDRVALVAPPPVLPQVIPFGSLPAFPLSEETARALLDAPALDPAGPVGAPAAGAGPAAPAPLAGLPIAPAPVVLPDPGATVPEIALPEPEADLPAPLPPLPTVARVVTLVGGLLSLPVL